MAAGPPTQSSNLCWSPASLIPLSSCSNLSIMVTQRRVQTRETHCTPCLQVKVLAGWLAGSNCENQTACQQNGTGVCAPWNRAAVQSKASQPIAG